MDGLAATCEEMQRHASRVKKAGVLADYFKTLDEQDFALAVQLLGAGAELKIGGSVWREALREATGWDKETLSICHAQVGDRGETIGLLMRGIAAGEAMSLATADSLYQELFEAKTSARRVALLAAIFQKYRPLTLKYFVKLMTRGLRIGLKDALALAERATALEARLFQASDFMLAKTLDRVEELADPAAWVVEDKYDGIRAQVHFERGRVRIFARGLEEITHAFPEIVEAHACLPGSGLLDGEILAWREGRALNFNILQRRLKEKQIRAIPAIFMAYDLLLRNDAVLLGETFCARRAKLEQLSVAISPLQQATSHAELERLYSEARARGNQGLLLKRPDSVYEAGKRSGAWLKVKRPYGTLEVVITAAEKGKGRRATVFAEYTFGVRTGSGFVNVGKANGGLTDGESKELTKQLRGAAVEKFGRMMLVKPEVVLEVAFDGVQRSRHKGGYALRLPRILRWRKDKRAEECDSIEAVEALYRASVEEWHG